MTENITTLTRTYLSDSGFNASDTSTASHPQGASVHVQESATHASAQVVCDGRIIDVQVSGLGRAFTAQEQHEIAKFVTRMAQAQMVRVPVVMHDWALEDALAKAEADAESVPQGLDFARIYSALSESGKIAPPQGTCGYIVHVGGVD